ncbi:alpha-L-fucosidase [Tessaracoccus sp. Y36]
MVDDQERWEALNDRATPEWFRRAKLGFFVHWGPYSVPAWAEPTGELGGATWGDSVLLDAGAAAYSVAAELPDGRLGVIWEAGDYAALQFMALSRAEVGLDGGAVSVVPVESPGGSAAPPEVAPDGS